MDKSKVWTVEIRCFWGVRSVTVDELDGRKIGPFPTFMI